MIIILGETNITKDSDKSMYEYSGYGSILWIMFMEFW